MPLELRATAQNFLSRPRWISAAVHEHPRDSPAQSERRAWPSSPPQRGGATVTRRSPPSWPSRPLFPAKPRTTRLREIFPIIAAQTHLSLSQLCCCGLGVSGGLPLLGLPPVLQVPGPGTRSFRAHQGHVRTTYVSTTPPSLRSHGLSVERLPAPRRCCDNCHRRVA